MFTFLGRWFVLFMILSFLINVMTNDNAISGIGGGILAIICAFVWGLFDSPTTSEGGHGEKEKPAPKPPRDWTPVIRTIQTTAVVAVVIIVSIFIGVAWVTSNWYPTQAPEVWARIKLEIGIPGNTSQPGWRDEMAVLVRASTKIPKWPDRESFVGQITDAARHNDLNQVIDLVQKSRDAANAYKVDRINSMVRVDLWVILLYVGINVANSLIAFRVSWPLPGPFKSKITTGAILVVVLALGIWFFWVQPEGKNAALDAFWWGGRMGLFTLAGSMVGVGLTLLGRLLDPSHPTGGWIAGYARTSQALNNPKAQTSLKISFAILGAVIGSITDTVFQAFILNGILVASNGSAVMMELIVMYLLGTIGFRFLASIIAPYTAAVQYSVVEEN